MDYLVKIIENSSIENMRCESLVRDPLYEPSVYDRKLSDNSCCLPIGFFLGIVFGYSLAKVFERSNKRK